AVQKYILNQTFYRPRDLVRLFRICIEQNKEAFVFNQQILEEAKKRYSEQTWTELAEELRVNYNKDDLDAIEEIFSGFKTRFSLGELRQRIEDKRNNAVIKLLDHHKLQDMLRDLYRIGMVGNDYRQKTPSGEAEIQHWAFRDDPRLLIDKRMGIH